MISTEQRIARKDYLGSSDFPAILGVDHWHNANDVYIQKTMDVADCEDTDAIDFGNIVEAPLVHWAAKKLRSRVETRAEILEFPSPRHPFIVSHPDALLLDRPGEGIEAKSRGDDEGFGEPGTDQVPDAVIIQAHVHMLCADLHTVHVPVILRFQRKLALYRLERNDALADYIEKQGAAFWNEHVIPRIPPENTPPPSIEILKRIRREPGTWTEVDDSLLSAWQEANEQKKSAEKAEEATKSALVAALGAAEGARFFSGTLTYLEQKRSGIDTDILKSNYPAIYQEVLKESQLRVLRFKKNK
jgi:predicted phage-related endonuclease